MKNARNLAVALCLLAAMGIFSACGSGEGTSTEKTEIVRGELAPTTDAPAAYAGVAGDAELARAEDGTTTVSLEASGLEPETAYLAHLHTGGCDQADPGGPHFQFEKGGSEEPPNEIHLRFTADADGEGEARASSKREVPVGEAGSVVLHLDDSHHEMSAHGPGESETVFVHEGIDHSKEGGSHEAAPEQAHSEKIACAELEGAASPAGGATAAGGEVPTIVVRDGEPVSGVEDLEYSAGEEIRFRVSSDAAEEIHVHGYDVSKDVPAGGTVEFAFPAELEGIYEAELEELGVQIVELRINP